MHFILVLYIYAGILGSNDEVALTNIPGFNSEQACIDAGNKSKMLVSFSQKDLKYICLQQ